MSPHKPEWQQNNWWRVVITDIWTLERCQTHTESSTLVNTCIISRERVHVAAFRRCFDPGAGLVGVVRCSLFTAADTEATPLSSITCTVILTYSYHRCENIKLPPHFFTSGYDVWLRLSPEGMVETIPMCQHLFEWEVCVSHSKHTGRACKRLCLCSPVPASLFFLQHVRTNLRALFSAAAAVTCKWALETIGRDLLRPNGRHHLVKV